MSQNFALIQFTCFSFFKSSSNILDLPQLLLVALNRDEGNFSFSRLMSVLVLPIQISDSRFQISVSVGQKHFANPPSSRDWSSNHNMGGSVLREWILEVREVKSEMKIWFTHFEKWKVKWKSVSLISRMKSEMKMPWYRDREWKVKWKCLKIEIENEKWNEIASRSRSRSEISREFSRNSWESRIQEILKFWSKWFSCSKLLLLSKM